MASGDTDSVAVSHAEAAVAGRRGPSFVLVGILATLIPLALTILAVRGIMVLAAGATPAFAVPWMPSLGVTLSFRADGLGLLFALLISGIGTLVMLYASSYLAGHPQLRRFYVIMLLFMVSMLGVTLTDNLLTLFIFWELTSITSYMLIGFNHTQAKSRAGALQALLVTGGGGLAMLAGLILLGQAGGTLEISQLLTQGTALQSHPLYVPMLLLILAGAFTKSAQFPFHFWLPNAMEAPTPVSAYLHSATMVKAGVYLLARLSPALGGTDLWVGLVTAVGLATMFIGAFLAWQHTDLKRILAYSTISALGTLVLLLGLGTDIALKAAMVFLLTHSLYKGALFLVAGAVDHETGTRDVTALRGLWRAMPITAGVATLAALSMAGLPPLFGFIAKELVYEATLAAPVGWAVSTVAVAANALMIVAAGLVAVRPFWGPKAADLPKKPHEAPLRLWLGPALLAALGLAAGLLPGPVGERIIAPAVAAVAGQPISVKLVLWHGVNLMLALSVITVLVGVALYAGLGALLPRLKGFEAVYRWGPERGYALWLDGLNKVAAAQTRVLQSGYLRYYLIVLVATIIALVGVAMVRGRGLVFPTHLDVRLHEVVLAALILLATGMALRASSRLTAVAALSVVGYSVALLYVSFGAPDLAMTQFAIDTLTLVLFVFVLYRLPRFAQFSSNTTRLRDAGIALAAGGLITVIVLAGITVAHDPHLSAYFAEHSLSLAYGRNVVNVILVDFRGLDTLGEITVLAVAAIGVYALLKLRLREGE